ncbi:sugar ABC transporter substrate-binding protein [Paenibacillus sp. FSL R5-0527]|uniref:Bacterial extracellular solute-binding family protein n=2 Tax=Paenibacillus macerans TaxID=44252 RepID=A0A090Y7N9_PAEMA|nr:sugar ABC transporter substrate-binding protein [Paenibacillus macerans]KFM94464.1 bacterial extracellular solute-binding family protein [Paenibacillus macerans]MCY7557788.1 sugar ABC transporter substrate-binding protein [Paenibacillus macerans]MEC0153521.1 sugar ABC transporter substrate-binding protein [Paenibacillus macerans]SUD25273.1 extracellular solute-binding protein [Paenibacillus macerans]
MNMRKKLAAAVAGALLVSSLALAGCGNSNDGDKAAGSASAGGGAQKNVTISYTIWDKNQQPAMEAIARAFTEQHPNIEVKVDAIPWGEYWTKMSAAAQAGTLPDVFWMHAGQFNKYAAGRFLEPITDKVQAGEIDLNNYASGLGSIYTLDGENYGVPKDFDTIGLAYNKELFDQAGIPYPDDTWDYAKLAEVAGQLSQPDKGIYGFGAKMDTQAGYWNDMLANGGRILNEDMTKSGYDEPASIEALKARYRMILDKASPTHQQMTDTDSVEMFKSGKLAMIFDGSWDNGNLASSDIIKDKYDWAPLPKGKAGRGNIINGLGNVMSAKGKHKEESWQFLKFLGSKEAAEITARMGAAIPAFKDTQDAWVKSKPDLNLQVFIDQAADATPYPSGSKSYPVWFAKESEIMSQAWGGAISIEEGAKKVADMMNQAIADAK